MPQPANLTKAEFQLIDFIQENGRQRIRERGEPAIKVQFNPETLTVAFSNQKANTDQRGGGSMQFVGQGVTKLTLDLWFDVSAPPEDQEDESVDDVRQLTQKISRLIQPEADGDNWVAPGVRFLWGTFLFNGIMDSINEKLEFFSENGKPLRAMLSLSLSNQQIQFEFGNAAGDPAGPGTTPFRTAAQGDTAQSLAGDGKDWKKAAAAQGIENPRMLAPGSPFDPKAGAGLAGGLAAGLAGSAAGAALSGGIGVGLGSGAGFGASAGASFGAAGGISIGASANGGFSGGVTGSVGAMAAFLPGPGAAGSGAQAKQRLIFP